MADTHAPDGPRARHDLLMGLALIVVGSAFLMDRIAPFMFDGRFWPFILLVFGAVKVAAPSRVEEAARSRRGGVWLLLIGLWGLVNEFGLFGFSYGNSWPLLIVGIGVMTVWRALDGPDACCARAPEERQP